MAAPRLAQIPAQRRAEARRQVLSGRGCGRRASSTIRALGVGQLLNLVVLAANLMVCRGFWGRPDPECLEAAAHSVSSIFDHAFHSSQLF